MLIWTMNAFNLKVIFYIQCHVPNFLYYTDNRIFLFLLFVILFMKDEIKRSDTAKVSDIDFRCRLIKIGQVKKHAFHLFPSSQLLSNRR